MYKLDLGKLAKMIMETNVTAKSSDLKAANNDRKSKHANYEHSYDCR